MGMKQYHENLRREIGEEAYRERMAAMRSSRKRGGGAFRKDYVDEQGRTGPEIASAARAKRKQY